MEDSSKLITTHVNFIRKDVISEEAKLLGDAIYQHLRNLIYEAGKTDTCYKVTELLRVGSYHEQTKINSPDEFDFIAVLDQMSEPGMVKVQTLDKDGVNMHLRFDHEHVKLIDPDVNWSWDKKPATEQLLERFLRNLVNTLLKDVKKVPYVSLAYTYYEADFIQLPPINGIELSVRYREAAVPNLIFEFMYKGKKIPVDLTLGFRYKNWNECYDIEEAPVQEIGKSVYEKGSVLFIAHRYGFRLTFTETEMEYVRDKVLGEHKILYMYLKYFNGKYGEHEFLKKAEYLPFSSYMLKTICIYHDQRCKQEVKGKNECLKDILAIMEESVTSGYLQSSEMIKDTKVGYLPSIFQVKKNLFREEFRTVDLLTAFRKKMILDLKTVHLTGRKWKNVNHMLEEAHDAICKTADWICSQTWSDSKSLLLVKPE
ncbi:uncharacterized protein LOC123563286 isoform X2 [Mercenaria mercenaria]|nr:uncharacterized protein LOC123563286 isoform X2 [Mercenaria mercenaria]XP_045211941.1 uncharacterized protein LOC123563286 isoform X2 [Mercenaria mercenaria]